MQNHSFSIIGLGKVGTSLLETLISAGNELIGVSTRDKKFGKETAKRYHCIFEVIPESILAADIVFIATNDASIETIGKKIIDKTKGVIAHTSGILTSEIFVPHKGRVSIHPALPVYKKFMDLMGKRFTIEGDKIGLKMSREILQSIEGKISTIDVGKKPLYHLASVVGSNFLNSIAFLCAEIYKIAGCNEDFCIEMMEETISGIKNKGIDNALTGPVERGDIETIKMDIEAIKDYPEWKKFILTLFELTTKLAKKRGVGDEKISRIMDVFTHYYPS